MKRPQLVSQGSIARMMQAASQALQQRDFQQAIEILERATNLDPANPGLLLQLGGAHAKRYDYSAAEACFDKAVRLASRKADALAAAAQFFRDAGDYERAGRFLQRAAEQREVTPEMLVKLAEIHERFRRLPEAVELTNHALHKNGACASAELLRAKLDRQTGKLEEAESRLRSLLTKAEPSTRVLGWYELGGLLDRQERYAEAMKAFLEAKALLLPHAAAPIAARQTIQKRLQAMQGNLTADMLHRWFDCGQTALQPPRRLALLGGHPRSGTTLLEQAVDIHPEVVSAEETPIFYDDACAPLIRSATDNVSALLVIESADPHRLRALRERYFQSVERFLEHPVGNRLLLDKNPSLTFFIPVLIRVFPEIKFLIALRDPRDVCLSCLMLPLMPLNQTAVAYLSLESTIEEYTTLMGMWRTAAPLIKNPYLEVRYEDMVEDLESVARKTLEFLRVPWDERVLGFDKHAREKVVRSPTYADVTQPVYKRARGRWRNYQKYLEPYLHRLEPFVKAFGYE